jgi:hypothetical protein
VCGWAMANDNDSLSHVKDSVFNIQPGLVTDDFLGEAPDILTEGALFSENPTDTLRKIINLGHATIEKVRELQNYITSLDQLATVKLPVGLKKYVTGINYDIAIDAIRLMPTHAEIDVYLEFKVPQNGQVLMFRAKGIKVTKKGGIVGDGKLELLGDYAINFNGDKVQLILKGGYNSSGTYATMDCDGFKELSIDAQVKFSRDLLRPEMQDGSIGEGNVVSTFKTTMTGWNDLIVQLDMPPFQVKGLTGVGFETRGVVFDFSDIRSASNVKFPKDYQSPEVLSGDVNLWKGFYMREMYVKLPTEFKTKDGGRKTFEGYDVIIDNLGVTGTFRTENLIPLEQGTMNGWAFSVDSLGFALQANELTQAGFVGEIVLPIAAQQTPFDYTALINPNGNYLFNVSPKRDLTFPLWNAGKVEIYEASYLDIRVVDHKFLPKANLHGRMNVTVGLSEGGQGAELADIRFENLELQTVKPYIKVGTFSFGSEALQQKMAGFPISIQDVGLRNITDTQVGLDFRVKLNLVGEESGSFAADAGLTLVGNIDAEAGIQSWRYKTVQVRDIMVDIDGGAFKINGKLIFYRNDAVYGDGFNGVVKAEFKPGIKVDATAIFGNVKSMRYWYADAMVQFPSGIPVFTGVGIYGFGGGAYYAMKMDNQGIGSELGKTASGVVYVPDTKAGLGLKAVVAIGTHPSSEAFNGDVTFEISFFRSGGVRSIAFRGNGYMVTPAIEVSTDKLKAATDKMVAQVKKYDKMVSNATMGNLSGDGNENSFDEIFGQIGAASGKKGQLSAHVAIEYDFENRVLHGNFEMYVNVAGGLLTGIGPGGRAGWAVMHFAPSEWYVYVGTPEDRLGISIGIGPIRANAGSYLMVGTKIMGSPPPPPNVSEILGGIDLDYMRNENALKNGGGFAFGSAFSVDTGDLQFLMFYAHFAAGAGFDIMLKDYGENTRCKGRSDPLGINGWYANGQAYAYFEGDIGIRVKVFGRKRSVEILSIGAAAVLQAKLPNPIWMRGIVGGRFSVLGGMVKGNCKFEVVLGEECQIVGGSALEGIQVISQVTPATGENDVSVFNAAQGVFNMEVGKEFELMDTDDVLKMFRVKLDHFKIMDGTYSVPGTLEWSAESDVLAFNPLDVLPARKKLRAMVQVSFEESVNGSWRPVVVDGKVFTESKESEFTTGDAPDHIPLSNVKYSYPVVAQHNYYKDETREGYIKLERGQPDLFNPGSEWVQKARVKTAAGSEVFFAMAYDREQRQINYSMPAELALNTVYAIEILNLPAGQEQSIDANVTRSTAKVGAGDTGTDTEIKSNTAAGTINILQVKSIFTSYFKTSAYATFNGKLSSINFSQGWISPILTGVHELGVNITGAELFDHFEINRSTNFDRLIELEATTDNKWMTNYVKPLVYPEGYPSYGLTIENREPKDVNVLGAPPVRAVDIRQSPSDVKLDLTNPVGVSLSGYGSIIYNLPLTSYRDYIELRTKAAAVVAYSRNAWMVKLVEDPFTGVINGDYNFKIRYKLPGTGKVTFERVMTIPIR